MTDAEKLRIVVRWIDALYPNDPNPEVQNDLREMANKLDKWGGYIPDWEVVN